MNQTSHYMTFNFVLPYLASFSIDLKYAPVFSSPLALTANQEKVNSVIDQTCYGKTKLLSVIFIGARVRLEKFT